SRAQGHYVIGASAATQQAQEAAQLKHGLLTYTLLAGMKAVKDGPLVGQNVISSDKIVNVRDWFGYAQDKVPLLTKLYFGEEQFIEFTGCGESFPVLPLPEE
ncbi:MAG: hypothetical protein KDA74_18070, partial [Planctomycetaceae bacterium]|nr:hypothetical protein [Planctomycetaceae bacterium]